MEIIIGENKISAKQSSKGFWYVDEMSFYCNSIIDGLELLDRAIQKVNKILKKYNNGIEEKKNKKVD